MNAPVRLQPQVLIVGKDHPLAQSGFSHFAEYTLTIEEMLWQIRADLPVGFLRHGEVQLNGVAIKRHQWRRRVERPRRDGDQVLSLHMPLQGGGGGAGGGKNTLATVASIAVLIAAAAVSGGALGLPALGLLSAGAVNAIAGAGIGIAGALVIGALTPPPSFDALARTKPLAAGSQNLTASLSGNVLQPGGPIPRVLGQRKVFPPFSSQPLLDLDGDDERIEASYALNGPHAIDQIRLAGIPVEDIDDTETEVTQGFTDDAAPTLVERYGFTSQIGLQLSAATVEDGNTQVLEDQTDPFNSLPVAHQLRTLNACDEFWIWLNWPGGMFYINTPGERISLPFRVRIRRRGSASWIRLPEIHFTHNKQEPISKIIKLHWADPPPTGQPPTERGPYAAFISVPMRAETLVGDAISGGNSFDGDQASVNTKTSSSECWSGLQFAFPRNINRVEWWPRTTSTRIAGVDDITAELRVFDSAPGSSTAGTLKARVRIEDATTRTAPIVFEWADTEDRLGAAVRLFPTAGGNTSYACGEIRMFGDGVLHSWKAHEAFFDDPDDFEQYQVRANVSTSNVGRVRQNYESADIYLDPAVFTPGVYDVEIIRGNPYLNSNFTPATYVASAGLGSVANRVTDLFGYIEGSADYIVIDDYNKFSVQCAVRHVSDVINSAPIAAGSGLAQIQIRTKRNGENLSVRAAGLVPLFNGVDGFDGSHGISTNPGDHFYDVLSGELASKPQVPARVHVSSIVELWHEAARRSYSCNAVIEGRDAEDVLQMIAGCAYGRLWQSERFGVTLDRDSRNEVPRQNFSDLNCRNYRWTKAFGDLASGFRVRIDNRENDWQEEERTILRPGASDTGIYDSVRYDGFDNWREAALRAQYDLLYPLLRAAIHSCEAPLRHIVSARGDLVDVSIDFLALPMGSGRVKTVVSGGGNVTGLILDRTVSLDPALGARFGAVLWLNDQTRAVHRIMVPVAAEETSELTFVTPFPDPGNALSEDCVVQTGLLGAETLRMKVADVLPKDEFTATVNFVDEAPTLWNRSAA